MPSYNPGSVAVCQGFDRLTDDHLEVAAFPRKGVLKRRQQLLDGGALAGRELLGADLLDPFAQLVIADVAHQPLREQAEELVVGSPEFEVCGQGSWT